MSDEPQIPLFDKGEWWEDHWKGMPEFVQEALPAFKTIYVHFETRTDMEAFGALVKQHLSVNTKSIWYPEATINDFSKIRYADAYEPGADDDES